MHSVCQLRDKAAETTDAQLPYPSPGPAKRVI